MWPLGRRGRGRGRRPRARRWGSCSRSRSCTGRSCSRVVARVRACCGCARAAQLRLDARLLGRDLRLPALRLRDADPVLGGAALHGHHHAGARRLRDLERRRGARSSWRRSWRSSTSRGCGRCSAAMLVLLPALAAAQRLPRQPRDARGAGLRAHGPPGAARHDHRSATRRSTSRRASNPLRELETKEPERFRAHVENGRKTYYQNCHFCHGDAMAGDGMYAHGLNPIPTNFTDPGTIAQLQESFLFWRIAKGGPGPARRGRAVGLGDAGLGEVPERGGDLGGRSSSSTTTPASGRARPERALMRALASRRCGSALLGCAALARAAASARRRRPPRRSSRPARRSTSSTAPSATARRATGRDPAAPHLLPRPRDFTTGKFKLRTTPIGDAPDRRRPRSAWSGSGCPTPRCRPGRSLSDAEVDGVVQYLKTFYAGFADPAQAGKPIALPQAPASTKETVEKGKELYVSLGCVRCHGETGRGEGPSAPTLKDDLGHPLRAADLTQRWTFRGGPRREDIFRTFSTGLNGTPMPSFYDSVSEPDRWALTDYVYSLGDGDAPGYATLAGGARRSTTRSIPRRARRSSRAPRPRASRSSGRSWSPAARSRRRRPRSRCAPSTTPQRIAFQVRWHDIRADTTATNSPTLEVPLADEALAAPAAAAPAAGGRRLLGRGGGAGRPAPAAGAGATSGARRPRATPAAAGPAAEFSDAVALQLPAQAARGRREAVLPVRRRPEARGPLVPRPRLAARAPVRGARLGEPDGRSRRARWRRAPATRPASGRRSSCATCARATACPSPRASTCPSRSRSGTARRASAATAAA